MGGEELQKILKTRGSVEGARRTRGCSATVRRAVALWLMAAFVFGALAGVALPRATNDSGMPAEAPRIESALGTVEETRSSGEDYIQHQSQSDVPMTVEGADVLVVHTLCLGPINAKCSELNALTSMLLAADTVASVSTWDFMNYGGIPTVPYLTFMQQFDVIVVATNWAYLGYPAFDLARQQLGDRLADYVDSGRGGVLTMMCVYCQTGTYDDFNIRGRYISQDYGPYESGPEAASVATGIIKLIPSDPLLDGVGTDVEPLGGAHASSLQVTHDGVEVAQWAPDHTSAVGKKIRDNGICTIHIGAFMLTGVDAEMLIRNAVLCAATTPNLPPMVAIHQPPSGSVFAVGTPVTFVGGFIDPNTGDAHTAEWSFGTIKVPGTVAESGGSGTVTDTYTFVDAGAYPVSLTVTDNHGASGVADTVDGLAAFVVVFDPRYATKGDGWIMSPNGAYLYDPFAAGKATFDFFAKYHKGGQVPEGNIQFQFKAGHFAFASSAFRWLVCGGATCQFKGAGTATIGHGPTSLQVRIEFLVTVVDGGMLGGGASDGFRIKIWNQDDGSIIIYDNLRGQPDGAQPPAIERGNIRILHR